MHRSLVVLHRWLGLLNGVLLLLIGVSGSVLVYSGPLDRLLNPALYSLDPTGPRLSLDSAYAIVHRTYASRFASLSLDMPATERDAYAFTLTGPQEKYHARSRYLVNVHPYSGAILREGSCDDISTSFIHWLMYFHNSFHLGRIGMLAATLASVSILLSIVTGVLVYGKGIVRALLFLIPLGKPPGMRFTRSLHVYVGVWALVFNVVVCTTGSWMMRGIFSSGAWQIDVPGEGIRLSAPLDRFLQRSREAIPGFEPDYVAIPLRRGDLLEIDGNISGSSPLLRGDASRVAFDPESGEIVAVTDVRSARFPLGLTAAVWPLHIGSYGGGAVKILYVIGGLLPGVLSVTGFLIWRRRRRVYTTFRRGVKAHATRDA